MTEQEIAQQIAVGVLPSPTAFMGNTFFAVRFSGTGVAYRPKFDEFTFRDPAVWLSVEMCRRLCGVPVISEHPGQSVLDGQEFYDRVIGVLILGFVRDRELWGVMRVVDSSFDDL